MSKEEGQKERETENEADSPLTVEPDAGRGHDLA